MVRHPQTLLAIGCSFNTLLVLGGCAVSPPIHTPGLVNTVVDPAENVQGVTPTIDIDFHSHQFFNQRPLRRGLLILAGKYDSERALKRQLRRFPFFNRAVIGSTGAPYRLQLESTQSANCYVAKAIIPAMTLYLLPFDSEYGLDLKGLLYERGRLLKTYEASTRFRISIQSWRIVIPWTWGVSVPDRAYEDTYADLFLQIQRDLVRNFWGIDEYR